MESAPRPEELIEAAKRYLEGKSSLPELNGISLSMVEFYRKTNPGSKYLCWAKKWEDMINRRWNEMGEQGEPINEAEFRTWLKKQIELSTLNIGM
mgnify:CR=1 FL=1